MRRFKRERRHPMSGVQNFGFETYPYSQAMTTSLQALNVYFSLPSNMGKIASSVGTWRFRLVQLQTQILCPSCRAMMAPPFFSAPNACSDTSKERAGYLVRGTHSFLTHLPWANPKGYTRATHHLHTKYPAPSSCPFWGSLRSFNQVKAVRIGSPDTSIGSPDTTIKAFCVPRVCEGTA